MTIPKRIAQSIMNSLKGGVVPRVGLPYITVGREKEIAALLHDVDLITEGGASCRFLTGRYGSGKTFLLQTMRGHCMDRGFVVMDADLSPERRLQGTHGQGLATYRALVANMSTRTRPDGGALPLILDRWISSVQTETAAKNGLSVTDEAVLSLTEQEISRVVGSLSEMVHGFDFARLLTLYYQATVQGDDEQKGLILKWFRGEYSSKSEARRELGVHIIVTDDDWYDYIRLFSFFLKKAGYKGLYVMIDELVNLYKIPNSISRQYNYEKILTIYNDTLQGRASYMGFLFCGTPECIQDTRRGLYSYEALRSRLTSGRFSRDGLQDLLAPVIHLEPLSPEELLILTEKLTEIHAVLYGYSPKLSQDDRIAFIKAEFSRVGASSRMTPREIIRDLIELLDILYQHPELSFQTVLGSDTYHVTDQTDPALEAGGDFAEFEL